MFAIGLPCDRDFDKVSCASISPESGLTGVASGLDPKVGGDWRCGHADFRFGSEE